MKKIPENLLLIIKALLPLSIIGLLFLIVTRLGIAQISSVRGQIGSARHEQQILGEKLDLFRTVASTGVSDSNVSLNAVPDVNPALLTMSQLKLLAANSNLILRSLRTTGESENEDVNFVEIAFNLSGERGAMELFLSSLNSFAPLTLLDSVKISESGTNSQAKVVVKSFWYPLPTKLPDTIEGFGDLSEEDRQLLIKLTDLTQPALIKLPDPSSVTNEAPFGL